MNSKDIMKMTALDVGRAIREGAITSVDATFAMLEAIGQKDARLNGYIRVFADLALQRAEEVQKKICAGESASPLAGVPFAIKDNICTEGLPTTCGSRMLADFSPPYSATIMKKIEEAGRYWSGS